jgi:hypothetical protein
LNRQHLFRLFHKIAFAEIVGFPYVKWLRKFCNKLGGVPAKAPPETIYLTQNQQRNAVPEEAAPLIHQVEGALAEYQKQMPQDVYQGASMLKNVLNNSSQRLADREGSYGNNSRGNMIGMNSFSDNV